MLSWYMLTQDLVLQLYMLTFMICWKSSVFIHSAGPTAVVGPMPALFTMAQSPVCNINCEPAYNYIK